MKKYVFNVPLLADVKVTLVQVEGREDKDVVLKITKEHSMDDEVIDYVKNYVANKEHDYVDAGDTIYDLMHRKILVILYPFTSDEMREEVIGHEKRHVEDRILGFCHIDDIETSAFLAGFLSKQFYKFKQLK